VSEARRRLGLLDCVAIGVNGIVGSGIYLLPGTMAARSGALSVLGLLACGVLCCLLSLCFAEAGSMFDRNGGPYLYARAAFGRVPGFAVGWLAFISSLLGFAAVSSGLGEAARQVGWEPLAALAPWVTPAAIAIFGLLNYLGVRAGATTVDALSLLKILPLVLLAVLGIGWWRGEALAAVVGPAPADSGGWLKAVAASAFLSLFMMSGFEFAAVPAGEVREPERLVPRALVGSVLATTLLYAFLLLAALCAVPGLASSSEPLAALAGELLGAPGRWLLQAAALVSMLAFCAGSVLVIPRYVTALAADGFIPSWLSRRSRFDTPGLAVAVTCAGTLALTSTLSFASLVDITGVVTLLLYSAVPLAVLVLRWRAPGAKRAFKLPGGPLIPLVSILGLGALSFLGTPPLAEWLFTGKLLAIGAGVWGVTAAARWALARRAA
jgi:APA family basic amino acid/polyamine antiporter